jgi:hypothetical protein
MLAMVALTTDDDKCAIIPDKICPNPTGKIGSTAIFSFSISFPNVQQLIVETIAKLFLYPIIL